MFPNLELEMFKKGMKPAQLAKECNICESAMRNKLSGKNEFKLSELRAIQKVFPNFSWTYLFAEKTEDQRPAG